MTSNVHPLKKSLQLRIELDWVSPSVWRVVVVPETISLPKLHRVIQIAMGWEDGHLHEFAVGNVRYGNPDPEWNEPGTAIQEKGVSLAKALGRAKQLRYTYDFGDGWEHTIAVEESSGPPDSLSEVRCLAGENACPPEDVGGPPGYERFLQAIADPNHEEHDDMLEWYEGEFDATRFDLASVNKKLKQLRI